jgi:hypothetical protein
MLSNIPGFDEFGLFEGAIDVCEEDEFRLYKEFEPQRIQQALDRMP